MRTSSLYLALLPLLCGLAAAFSVHQAGISGIKPTQISENRKNNKNNPRSAIISAVVAASLFAAQPSGAFIESGNIQSNQISITPPSNTASSSFSSLQLSNSMASPMGEFKPETDTGISPAFSTFGQWFFLLYVVVSLLAGAKEIGGRIVNKMNKDE